MRKALRGAALVLIAASGIALVYASREPAAAAPGTGARGAATDQRKTPPGTTAITNVRLFDGTQTIEGATVVFDERAIVSICTNCPAPSDARAIDGTGKTLLPGLIDAHTHSWGDALQRAAVFGVTTVIDMFTAPSFASARQAEQRQGTAFDRADLVSAGYLVTVAGGHGTEYGMPVPTFEKGMDPQRFIDERLAEGSEFIKLVYDDGGAFKIAFNTLNAADLAALIAATHARGKLAVVHVSTSAAARDAVLAGADGLVHSWGDDGADDALFAEIARRGVFVVPTLSVLGSLAGRTESADVAKHAVLGNYVTAPEKVALAAKFPETAVQKQALANARNVVRRLHAARVPLLAGTDAPNPGTSHGISLHRELELLVESGLSPTDALRAATSVPARTFGLASGGSVAEGLRADLVLVTGDPTTDIAATQNIVSVWKGGREIERREATVETAQATRVNVSGIISDFETGIGSVFGTEWMISTDQMMGGKSTATLAIVQDTEGGEGARGAVRAAGKPARVLRVDGRVVAGQMYPWAGAMLMLSTRPMSNVDIRPAREISFRLRSASPVRLMVFAGSKGRIPATKDLPAAPAWTTITVALAELGLDGSDLQALLISGVGETFSYELDDVSVR